MKNQNTAPYLVQSISEQHRLLSLPKPYHPLVSVFRFEDIVNGADEMSKTFVLGFYCIAIKKGFTGKLKYGQHYYDFDEGVLSFISPGQLLSRTADDETPVSGWCLVFHPDFIAPYPLGKSIKNYGFFSYTLYEALHLSDTEEGMIETIFQNIEREYKSSIDNYTQDVIVSQIEMLLHYSNRFYNRQFITRKHANNDLLIQLEKALSNYFDSDEVISELPSVQYISSQLHLSPNYLSDMLRALTGQSAQQHIHARLIEKAKDFLSTTDLSVGEIAYRLGFQYPQSFNKFFKKETAVSPLQFRQSFN